MKITNEELLKRADSALECLNEEDNEDAFWNFLGSLSDCCKAQVKIYLPVNTVYVEDDIGADYKTIDGKRIYAYNKKIVGAKYFYETKGECKYLPVYSDFNNCDCYYLLEISLYDLLFDVFDGDFGIVYINDKNQAIYLDNELLDIIVQDIKKQENETPTLGYINQKDVDYSDKLLISFDEDDVNTENELHIRDDLNISELTKDIEEKINEHPFNKYKGVILRFSEKLKCDKSKLLDILNVLIDYIFDESLKKYETEIECNNKDEEDYFDKLLSDYAESLK